MISSDKPIEFVTIQNLGYNARIIEGAIKLSQLISVYSIFPNLVNRLLEAAIDDDALRHIFTRIEDITDFAQFIVHNLANNIFSRSTSQ